MSHSGYSTNYAIATSTPTKSGRKRKQPNYAELDDGAVLWDDDQPLKRSKTIKGDSADHPIEIDDTSPKRSPRKKRGKNLVDGDGTGIQEPERRLRRYRAQPPQSYIEIKARALTQRLTIQSRERCGTDDEPEEEVSVAGTTGNLYTVIVGKIPSCNCPHANKGNQCKHIIYVMLRVLKAPEHIAYQLALISSELQDLFANAPPIPNADAEADASDGNRKPIEGDCPICYTEFEPDKEAIVYCKAACGNNVHKECMQNWMQARSGRATCPMCRAAWENSDVLGKKVDLKNALRNKEGYINIASQLGLSGDRDYSSYHQPWVRSRRGYGGGYY